MKDNIREINRWELLAMRGNGEHFVLVDVLPSSYYEEEHIRGAISIPVADIEKKAGYFLDKNEKIVIYCAHMGCSASTTAARRLLALGFTQVFDYKGGIKDWKESGFPIEGRRGRRQEVCVGEMCGIGSVH